MIVYPIDKEAHKGLFISLRNHRMVVLTAMFVCAVPGVFETNTSIYPYVGVWLFYIAVLYFSMNPNRSVNRITSISLDNESLSVNLENKVRRLALEDIRLIVNKKYGIFIFAGRFKGSWIPKSVEDLDIFFNHISANVTNKVFSRARNPVYYLMVLIFFVSLFQISESPISSISIFLANLIFWFFME